MEMLLILLDDMYMMKRVFVDMADVGHSGASRSRVYIICILRSLRMLADPVAVAESVFQVLRERFQTVPSDYMGASALEVQLEAAEVCRVRKLTYQVNPDLTYILNERERNLVTVLGEEYQHRYAKPPQSDCDLVYFLGDNASWSITWSASSRRLPCLRRNSSSGKFWVPSRNRWLTATERPPGCTCCPLSPKL